MSTPQRRLEKEFEAEAVRLVETSGRTRREIAEDLDVGQGNCFDNSMVETFFKTLKSELVWRTVFQSRAEATAAIGR